jgi:hypothetical protein
LARFDFKSGTILFCFSFTFVLFGESCLLVSWCAGGRCGMVCSDVDYGRSRRPGAKDRGWSHRSGIRWPGDREVGWHRVCTVHVETRSAGFFVEPQNQGRRFVCALSSKSLGRFCLKTSGDGIAVWPQNLMRRFSPVWPQNWWRRFLPVCPQNWRSVS